MAEVTHSVADAAAALAAGNLVALPTETVYGLGASLDHSEAVSRIFQVKNRPADHPLIVHIEPDADVARWASHVPATADRLIAKFWPGPLTIVVAKSDRVPTTVTGGQDTVALRAPDNRQFLDVLATLGQLTGTPAAIAAPSANQFGQVSPTTAAHVVAGLGPRLDADDVILDGGPCEVGIESTIVLCREHDVEVLRPGKITAEALAEVVTVVLPAGLTAPATSGKPRVSGSLDSHYSPVARVMLAESDSSLIDLATTSGVDLGSTGVIALASENLELGGATELARPQDLHNYAAQLYSALRQADDLGLRTVIAVAPPNTGIGVGIRDRLTRAAR